MFASHHLPPLVPVNRSCLQHPTLTTSEVDQHRFEDQLFSSASPAGAQLHRNRIEELLLSPTSLIDELLCLPHSPVGVHALQNPVKGIAFDPPSLAKEIMPPQDCSFYIPPPNPRFFEELHSERTYLLDCLQIENRKATELLRSVPPLEERLIQNDSPSFERKRIRKRLGWLRHKLVETNRQERRVLARLGQVTLEIQTRERWTQIDFEHRQGEVERYHTRYGTHRSSPSPELAVFQPKGSKLPWSPPDSWQQWQSRDGQMGCEGNYRLPTESAPMHSSGLEAESYRIDGVSPDDVTPRATSSSDLNTSHNISLIRRSSSLNDAAEQLEACSTGTTATFVPRVKRFSLPGCPGQSI